MKKVLPYTFNKYICATVVATVLSASPTLGAIKITTPQEILQSTASDLQQSPPSTDFLFVNRRIGTSTASRTGSDDDDSNDSGNDSGNDTASHDTASNDGWGGSAQDHSSGSDNDNWGGFSNNDWGSSTDDWGYGNNDWGSGWGRH